MHPEVTALLALQKEDEVVEEIQSRMDAVAPRLEALDAAREKAQRAMRQLQASIDTDERKQHDAAHRLADHKIRHEHNMAQLDQVKRMREATAAVAQVEMGRKVLVELEGEVRDLGNRVTNARQALSEQQARISELEEQQASLRQAIEAETKVLEAEMKSAQTARSHKAKDVPAPLLSKYDRIRARRRSKSVFQLDGGACGACNTAIPVQRRSSMGATGACEVCEGCGVLMYSE